MPAVITLGAFAFTLTNNVYVPRYGFSETHAKSHPTAPGFFENKIKLSGAFNTRTHIDAMDSYNALKSAIREHEQTLLIVDGGTIFSRTVYIDSHNVPTEWNTKFTEFEINVSYRDTDLTQSDYFASFAGFVLDPVPSLSQTYTFVRREEREAIQMVQINFTLSGFFQEIDFNANLIKIIALKDAMNIQKGLLIYRKGGSGGLNFAEAYSAGISASEEFVTDVAPYVINFNVFIPDASLPANVIEEDIQITDRVGFNRFVAHFIPGLDGRTVIPLGLSDSKFTISGFVETDSFANSLTRISDILTANVPGNAILETQSQIQYRPGSARVSFSNQYSYNN